MQTMQTINKYYAVETMCGHVGRNKFIRITFPIWAESGKKAAAIAKQMPRVKKHQKDVILDVKRISEKEYYEILEINKDDPYLHIHCIQDQRRYCPAIANRIETIQNDSEAYRAVEEKRTSKKQFYDEKKRIRNERGTSLKL